MITQKIHDYCEGRRHKMKKLIKDKVLIGVDTEEGLMSFVDEEMKLLYKYIKEGHREVAITELWRTMEEEIQIWFDWKKKRNQSKNKLTRFKHLKIALPIIIDVKTKLYNDGIFRELGLEKLHSMQKETSLMTTPTSSLISAVLRRRAGRQRKVGEVGLEENQTDG